MGEPTAAETNGTPDPPSVAVRLGSLLGIGEPSDPQPSPPRRRRRRLVAAVTLVVGAALLWLTLNIRPGDGWFYPSSLAVAVVWATGGLAGGGLRLGSVRRSDGRRVRPVREALFAGAALVALFILGALVVAKVPVLRGPVDDLLDHARFGSIPVVLAITLVSGVAEEMFFRGTLYSALPECWAIPATSSIYALVTAVSGVPLLVIAAVLLGIMTGLQRRTTGGVLAPAITHIIWSSSMLLLLPPLLAGLG